MRKLINLLLVLCMLSAFAACSAPAVSYTPATPSPPPPTPSPSPSPTPLPTPLPTPTPFGKPNIYLIMLDEYGTFDMTEKYYGYDNKVLEEFLKERGFNISYESYSTDNQTRQSICDFVYLEYVSRHLSKSKSTRYTAKAPLYKIMSDMGYAQFQNSIDSSHFKGLTGIASASGKKGFEAIKTADSPGNPAPPLSAAVLALLEDSKGPMKVNEEALNEWGFYPSELIRKSKAYKANKARSHANRVLKVFGFYENPANYAVTSPRMIYSYILSNHVPFVFNEYGGIIPFSDSRDWRDENVYLGQYKFINKHLMASVSTIIANDPDSVIIIMSDHGIRYHADCTLKHKFYITDKDSLRIINAVYIKGDKYDIEGLSAINTMRFVLSLFEGNEGKYPPIQDHVTSESPDNLKGIIPKHR